MNAFDHAKATICAYTSQHPIKQAIWCTFHDQRPVLSAEREGQHISENKIAAVCVVDAESLRVFTADNEDFIDSVPFSVGHLWNTKYGIFLEKQRDGELSLQRGFKECVANIVFLGHVWTMIEENKTPDIDNSPKLYSLGHPLEEIHPVAIKDSTLSLIDNFSLKIVFTSEDPSIAVVYNSQTGNHCVYYIKKLKPNEWLEKTEKTNTMHSSINTSSKVGGLQDILLLADHI